MRCVRVRFSPFLPYEILLTLARAISLHSAPASRKSTQSRSGPQTPSQLWMSNSRPRRITREKFEGRPPLPGLERGPTHWNCANLNLCGFPFRRTCEGSSSHRYVVDGLGASVVAGHDILGIRREAVLRDVQSFDLAFGRNAQAEDGLRPIHQGERRYEGCDR